MVGSRPNEFEGFQTLNFVFKIMIIYDLSSSENHYNYEVKIVK